MQQSKIHAKTYKKSGWRKNRTCYSKLSCTEQNCSAKIKHCLLLCFCIVHMAFSLELSELLSKCYNTAKFVSHIRNHFSRSDSYICDLSVLRDQSFLLQSLYAPKEDPIYNSWQSYSPEMTVLKCAWSISMMSWVSGNVHNSGLWVTLFCCSACAVRPFVHNYLCYDIGASAGLACGSPWGFFGFFFWDCTALLKTNPYPGFNGFNASTPFYPDFSLNFNKL